jgi:hypothetical protein
MLHDRLCEQIALRADKIPALNVPASSRSSGDVMFILTILAFNRVMFNLGLLCQNDMLSQKTNQLIGDTIFMIGHLLSIVSLQR